MSRRMGTAGWARRELSEVCEVRSGIGFPTRLQGRSEGDIPFGKVSDISIAWKGGQRYLRGAAHYVSETDAAELRAKLMPPGTVVMAKIGEAVKLNRRAIPAQAGLMDNNVMGWVPNEDVVRSKFLFYFSLTMPLEELTRATYAFRSPVVRGLRGERRRDRCAGEACVVDVDEVGM